MKRQFREYGIKIMSVMVALIFIVQSGIPLFTVLAKETSACPNHAQHSVICGYVEGDSTHPCTHICEECATPKRMEELRKLNAKLDEELATMEKGKFANAPKEYTPEYQQAYLEIYDQIQAGKMSVNLPSNTSGLSANDVKLNHDVRINLPAAMLSTDNDKDIRLNFTLTQAVDYPISFRVRTLDGSAMSSTVWWPKHEYTEIDRVIYFSPGETTEYVDIDIHNSSIRVAGEQIFYLLYDEPVNAVFAGDSPYTDNSSVAIKYNNPYHYEYLNNGQNVFYGVSDKQSTCYNDGPYIVFIDPRGSGQTERPGDLINWSGGHVYTTPEADVLIKNGIATRGNISYHYPSDSISKAGFGSVELFAPFNVKKSFHTSGDETTVGGNTGPDGNPPTTPAWAGHDLGTNDTLSAYITATGYGDSIFGWGITWTYYWPMTAIHGELSDAKAPQPVSIAAPYGTYHSGDVIPITATYSEPIRSTDVVLDLDDCANMNALEIGTVSTKMTFLYTVKPRNDTELYVKNLHGAKDYVKNEQIGNWAPASRKLDGIVIKTPRPEEAFRADGVSNIYPKDDSGKSYTSYIQSDNAEVKIEINRGDTGSDLSQWIVDEYGNDKNDPIPRVKLSIDGGETLIPVDFPKKNDGSGDPDDEAQYLVGKFPLGDYPIGEYDVCLYIDPDKRNSFRPVIGKHTKFQIAHADVTGVDISAKYGITGENVLLDGGCVKLSDLTDVEQKVFQPITFASTLTPKRVSVPQVSWEVRNADTSVKEPIAEFTATGALNGELSFTGKAYGDVIVTSIAKNGLETETNDKKWIRKEFHLTVIRDISLFSGMSTAVQVGNGGILRWMNSDGAEYSQIPYKISLYNTPNGELSKNPGKPQNTYTTQKGVTSYDVEASVIPQLSVYKDGHYLPSYIAVVEAEDQFNKDGVIRTEVPIFVYPKPVKVTAGTKDENLFVLDTLKSVDFKAELENLVDGDAEASYVKNNGETQKLALSGSGETRTGVLAITPVADNMLKDVYIVTVKSKNKNATYYSSDSFVLQVYNKDALKVLADDKEVDPRVGITLSNIQDIPTLKNYKGVWTQQDSDAIIELQRQIDLKKYVNIDYKGFDWNTISDQMKWDMADSDKASINYRNGTTYEDMRLFGYTQYRPDEKFLMVGHNDGDTRVTVTHGRTGNQVSFNTHVETLKDKLYLFQCYPRQATTLTYFAYADATKTKTVERVFATNANGEFAVYEPYGIASDVRFTATKGEDTWYGTVFNSFLMSQEKDASRHELYPLNVMNMRKVTNLTFHLKDEAGNPYTGPVTYSYGVYKNGVFCPNARINSDPASDPRFKGVIRSESGTLAIKLDSSQFATQAEIDKGQDANLKTTDKLEYVVEMEYGDKLDEYRPKVAQVSADLSEETSIQRAESILILTKGDINKPFVDSYTVQYKDKMAASYDATYNKGYVGISDTFKEVDLKSRAIWCDSSKIDETKSKYSLSLTDLDGKKLKNQKSSTIIYPFGKYPVTTNVLAIDDDLLNSDETIQSKSNLYDESGTLCGSYPAPFKIINLIGKDSTPSDDTNILLGSATQPGPAGPLCADGKIPLSAFVPDNGGPELSQLLNPSTRSGKGSGGFSGEAFGSGGYEPAAFGTGLLDGMSIGMIDALPVRFNWIATDDPCKWQMIGVIGVGIGRDTDDTVSSAPITEVKSTWQQAAEAFQFADRKEDALERETTPGMSLSANVEGYVQGEFTKDPETGEWKKEFTGGGIKVSGSLGYAVSGNYLPFTFSIGVSVGLDVGLDFSPMSLEKEPGGADIYTDFLTSVALVVEAKGFAGLGIDLGIIGARFGFFGNVSAGINAKMLRRDYLASNQGSSYNYFQVQGEIGIKLELYALVFSYEKTLTSAGGEYHRYDTAESNEGVFPTQSDFDAITGNTVLSLEQKKNRLRALVKDIPKPIWDSYDGDGASLPSPEGKDYEDFDLWSPMTSNSNANALNTMMNNLNVNQLGNLRVLTNSMRTESRAYQDDKTTWANPYMRSIDPNGGSCKTIVDNIYPGSQPQVTKDGNLMVFRTDSGSKDLNDIAIGWAKMQNGSYVLQDGVINGQMNIAKEGEKEKLSNTTCTGLSIDGTDDFAVAVWEQQDKRFNKPADAQTNPQDLQDMMNHSEIMVSVCQKGVWGKPCRLTDNAVPDMAPQVSVNNGHAVVAWRQPMSSDQSDPTNFNVSNEISYSCLNGSAWSTPARVDGGDLGAVKGFDIATADDGTAIVVSTVQLAGSSGSITDTSNQNADVDVNSTREIVYSIIGADGKLKGERVRLTDDKAQDEVPQAAFADGKFVIGWYSIYQTESQDKITGEINQCTVNDIKLRAIEKDGSIDNKFADSISAINGSRPMEIGSNFTFVQSAENKGIDGLSMMWTTSETSDNQPVDGQEIMDKNVVYGAKFIKDDERVIVSAPLEVADMGNQTTADSYSGYLDGNTIKAVILSSAPDDRIEERITDSGEVIKLQATKSNIVSATETFKDSIEIISVDYDVNDVHKGYNMPIQFTVLNTGISAIDSLTATVNGKSVTLGGVGKDSLNIMPNQISTITGYLQMPQDKVVDANYAVQASFAKKNKANDSGSQVFTKPDISIGQITTLKQANGEREISVPLYNGSDVLLEGSKNTVVLNMMNKKSGEIVRTLELSNDADLALIDQDGYAARIKYQIPKELLNEKGEIPEDGIGFLIEVCIKNNGLAVEEFNLLYNQSHVNFQSLLKLEKGRVKVESELDNSTGKSVANITVKNLSFNPDTLPGNLLVSLLDESGCVIETKQLSQSDKGLLKLGCEADETRSFSFDKKGVSVSAIYLPVENVDSGNNELSLLNLEGISFGKEGFRSDKQDYILEISNLGSTLLTASAKSPTSKVRVEDTSGMVLAQETGSVSVNCGLIYGDNILRIIVTPKDGTASEKTYSVVVKNARDTSGNVSLSLSSQSINGWVNKPVNVSLTAENLKNFTPTEWQYNLDGGNWQIGSKEQLTTISKDGEYVVQGRVLDESGYQIETDKLSVKIDQVNPKMGEITLTKTQTPLNHGNAVVGLFAKLRGWLEGDGNTDKQLKVSLTVTDERSGIESVTLYAGEKAYPMVKKSGSSIFEATVTEAYQGALNIRAIDLAENVMEVSTGKLVIDDSLPDPVSTETVSVTQVTAGITGKFAGEHIDEYGIQYRKQGDSKWLEVTPENGSTEYGFTYKLSGLKADSIYEYRTYARLITKKDAVYSEVKEFKTAHCACTISNLAIHATDIELNKYETNRTIALNSSSSYEKNGCDEHPQDGNNPIVYSYWLENTKGEISLEDNVLTIKGIGSTTLHVRASYKRIDGSTISSETKKDIVITRNKINEPYGRITHSTTQYTATISGAFVGQDVAEHRLEYRAGKNGKWMDANLVAGSDATKYSYYMDNLIHGLTYEYRITTHVLENADGMDSDIQNCIYGKFTTKECTCDLGDITFDTPEIKLGQFESSRSVNLKAEASYRANGCDARDKFNIGTIHYEFWLSDADEGIFINDGVLTATGAGKATIHVRATAVRQDGVTLFGESRKKISVTKKSGVAHTDAEFSKELANRISSAPDGSVIQLNAKYSKDIPVAVLSALNGNNVFLQIKWNGGSDILINGKTMKKLDTGRSSYTLKELAVLYAGTKLTDTNGEKSIYVVLDKAMPVPPTSDNTQVALIIFGFMILATSFGALGLRKKYIKNI